MWFIVWLTLAKAMFCHCWSVMCSISAFNAGGKDCFMLRSSNPPPFSICNLPVLPVHTLPRRLTMFLTNAQCYCCNGPQVLKAMKLNTPFLTFIHPHVCYYLHLTLGPSQNQKYIFLYEFWIIFCIFRFCWALWYISMASMDPECNKKVLLPLLASAIKSIFIAPELWLVMGL